MLVSYKKEQERLALPGTAYVSLPGMTWGCCPCAIAIHKCARVHWQGFSGVRHTQNWSPCGPCG